jgi:hypothetical protein
VPRNTREWIAVLWPAFVAACVLEMVVFAAFDPHDFNAFGLSIEATSDAIYSIAFFTFWLVTAATGIVTWNLSRTSEDINRWPPQVPVSARPSGGGSGTDLRGPGAPPAVPPEAR